MKLSKTTLSIVTYVASVMYYWYRYPFKFNSTGTSPTYSDTPLPFKVGKYVLLVMITGMWLLYGNLKWRQERKVIIFAWVLAFWFLICSAFDPEELSTAFCFIIFAGMVASNINYAKIALVFSKVSVALLVIQALQILAFFLWGRLPALGYSNSLSVRFGSIWDDPNAYGNFLVAMIYFHWVRGEYAILIACIPALFATQSLTAVGTFLITLPLFFAMQKRTYRSWLKSIALIFLFIAAVLLFYAHFKGQIDLIVQDYSQRKSASAGDHAKHLDISSYNVWNYLGISPVINFSESNVINLLSFGGVPFVLAFYVPIFLLAIRSLIKIKEQRYALFFFLCLICFMIGSVGLPLGKVFPYNIFICFVAAWAYAAINHKSSLATQ